MANPGKKLHNPIGSNLTGGQIERLTNYLLLAQALRPLYVQTTYLDSLPYEILNATVIYPRRKLSGLNQNDLTDGLCDVLIQPTRRKAWEAFSKLRVERTSVVKRVTKFLAEYEDSGYEEAYQGYLLDPSREDLLDQIEGIERYFGCQQFNLWHVYRHVKAYSDVFFEFRGAVVEQFMYLARKSAGYYYQNRTRDISFDDLLQNVLASIAKALDRYDAQKGALTSYINFWLINAQAQDKHAEGLAYDVPNSTKVNQASGKNTNVNFAVSLTKPMGEELTLEDTLVSQEPTPEQHYEQAEQENLLLILIKCADVGGIFRLTNGLKEVFLPNELKQMQRYMEDNKLLEDV